MSNFTTKRLPFLRLRSLVAPQPKYGTATIAGGKDCDNFPIRPQTEPDRNVDVISSSVAAYQDMVTVVYR
jgi:hypothetical protein